jgi:large subunit ribosomal protein L4
LQNWRQGTVGCKNRSEVAFANRKPWKQKGTGRARAGSARSPLWRKGGIIFGPQPRTRTLKLSQQAKSNVLQTLFVQFMEHKRLLLLNWQADNKNPSTKSCYQALKEANIAHSKITLFLTRDDVANWMAFRNIPNIQIISFDDVNAYTLSHGEYVVVLKKDFDGLKEMVAKWN